MEEERQEKRQRIERSESDKELEALWETSQSSSQLHKEKMTNISLSDSDEEVIVDFVKEHKELYNKINKLFKNKVRKDSLWEIFAKKILVCPGKTWFESQRTPYDKLQLFKSGHAPKELTDIHQWIHHQDSQVTPVKGINKSSGFKSPVDPVPEQDPHTNYPEALHTDSIEINMHSSTHQPSTASNSVLRPSSVDQQVLDQFSQMKQC